MRAWPSPWATSVPASNPLPEKSAGDVFFLRRRTALITSGGGGLGSPPSAVWLPVAHGWRHLRGRRNRFGGDLGAMPGVRMEAGGAFAVLVGSYAKFPTV
jgi:hypothetical protein